MKVKLEYETERTKWAGDRTELVIYLDDKEFYRGSYGGEPEDNTYYRDYSWVRDAMEGLAKALGANVELSEKKVESKF